MANCVPEKQKETEDNKIQSQFMYPLNMLTTVERREREREKEIEKAGDE